MPGVGIARSWLTIKVRTAVAYAGLAPSKNHDFRLGTHSGRPTVAEMCQYIAEAWKRGWGENIGTIRYVGTHRS